jgi:nucleoside-diphosphate-sugar epimerase
VGYRIPAIQAPYFTKNWGKEENEKKKYSKFVEKYGNSPLVSIGTGIIAQGLHEIARVHNHGFHIGGIDSGLDITSKASIRGFLTSIIKVHGLEAGDCIPVFNGAAFLSASPNISGSIDVNVGGAINLIVIAQQIKAETGVDLVIMTPSSIARDHANSPYGIGKKLVEKLTVFQNLSPKTDFRSVILPGLISGLNPTGGSTDTYDGLAKHVAHLIIYNEAKSSEERARISKILNLDLNYTDFISFVRTDRKVAMAGIKDVASSLMQVFAMKTLPDAIPICGGPRMSYSVDEANNALKEHLGSSYPSFKIVERLGVQQKNLEEWGPIGTELPNVDDKYGLSTIEEDLNTSTVRAYEHYRKIANINIRLSNPLATEDSKQQNYYHTRTIHVM